MCFWKSLKGLHYFIDSQSNLDQEEPLGSFSPTPYWKQVPLAQAAHDFFSWVLNTLFSQISNIPKKADIHIFVDKIFCCLTTLTVIFFFYAQMKLVSMQLLIIALWYFDMPLHGSVFSITTGHVFSYQCKTWQLQIAMSPHPVAFPLPFGNVLYMS